MQEQEFAQKFDELFRSAIDEVVPIERVDLFVFDDRDRRQWFRERMLAWLERWRKSIS